MLRLVMPQALTVVVDVVAWGVFHATTGYAAHRLSDAWLDRDRRLLRLRGFESGGRWYRHWLRIDRWKDRLPEAGDLFTGGVSKRQLPGRDARGLQLFVRETRRAELAHWWAMCCGPVFVLWNPPFAAALLIGYGVLVNLPFIAIQRFNRARAVRLVDRLAHRPAARHPGET